MLKYIKILLRPFYNDLVISQQKKDNYESLLLCEIIKDLKTKI